MPSGDKVQARVSGCGSGPRGVTQACGSLNSCPGLVFRKPLLGKAEDFTIYIKNFIRFPKFNFSKYVGLGYWSPRGGALAGPPGGCEWVPVYVSLVYE